MQQGLEKINRGEVSANVLSLLLSEAGVRNVTVTPTRSVAGF